MRRLQTIYLHFKLVILISSFSHVTVLDPLGHRISDKVKISGDRNDQFCNISRADKELLSPRAAGAVSQP